MQDRNIEWRCGCEAEVDFDLKIDRGMIGNSNKEYTERADIIRYLLFLSSENHKKLIRIFLTSAQISSGLDSTKCAFRAFRSSIFA